MKQTDSDAVVLECDLARAARQSLARTDGKGAAGGVAVAE